jgi:flagellum-specific ATP synthase
MPLEEQQRAQQFRRLYSLYQQNRDLINVGAYQAGSDPEIDLAIRMQPEMMRFLAQDMHQAVPLQQSYTQLQQLVAGFSQPPPQAAAPAVAVPNAGSNSV